MAANYDWLKMVQNANGGPLPLVTDPLAGQYGAQQQDVGARQGTAQDTGWSSTATPTSWMSVDYGNGQQPGAGGGTGGVSASGSSPFGYTYSNPGAGFNPWGLYDGGTGYKGGDGVGLYDPSKDSAKGWGPNGQTETDRDRVWRMTLDDLKAKGLDPGAADPATVQAAFLNNVSRLHRDYDQTYGPQAWAGSAFSGYDKLAGGTGVGGGQQPLVNDPLGGQAGQTTTTAPAGQQGGTSVATPGDIPQQTIPNAGGPTGNPPGYGTTTNPNSVGGSAGGIDQLYQNNQAYRTAQLLKALGLGDINSQLSYGGSVIAQQAPGLFEAWREAQGAGGGGLPNDMGQIGAFANTYNSPGALGNIAQTGQQGLNWLLGQGGQGLKDTEMIPLIQAFEQLANLRQSDTMNRYYGNLTDQGLGQFLKGINAGNVTSARLAPYLQSNPLFGFLTGHH